MRYFHELITYIRLRLLFRKEIAYSVPIAPIARIYVPKQDFFTILEQHEAILKIVRDGEVERMAYVSKKNGSEIVQSKWQS